MARRKKVEQKTVAERNRDNVLALCKKWVEVREIAEALCISRQTAKKWLDYLLGRGLVMSRLSPKEVTGRPPMQYRRQAAKR